MQKIGSITPTADVNGEWTNGNVAGGIAPTILDAAWLNTVQRELAGVVTSSGLTLDPTNDGQVLAGLKLLINKALTGVVGGVRNGAMNIPTASASATFTADELIVETSGGTQYRLNSFSQTINLATVGVGGMDVGAAPVSGYVGIYAFFNPITGARCLIGVNATSAKVPEIYGGSNMPAGYTASALVSVWPTTAAGLMLAGGQTDRLFIIAPVAAIMTSTIYPAGSTLSIAGVIPKNAKTVSGSFILVSTVTSSMNGLISGSATRFGEQGITATVTAGLNFGAAFSRVALTIPQTVGIIFNSSAGTPMFSLFITSYEI